jgi:hypothetical protein
MMYSEASAAIQQCDERFSQRSPLEGLMQKNAREEGRQWKLRILPLRWVKTLWMD